MGYGQISHCDDVQCFWQFNYRLRRPHLNVIFKWRTIEQYPVLRIATGCHYITNPHHLHDETSMLSARFNKKLLTHESPIEHTLKFPAEQVHCKRSKLIIWIKNTSDLANVELTFRRIKNCECKVLETRVGFNQFRKLYHCPHRNLLTILQENILIRPKEKVAMSLLINWTLPGRTVLKYEVRCSSSAEKFQLVYLNFEFDIVYFDPLKCLITQKLFPTQMRDFQRFVQPIWLRNIYHQDLSFRFSSNQRGLYIINPLLFLPKKSTVALLVQYRPCDFENELQLNLSYEEVQNKLIISARGILNDEDLPLDACPLEDFPCADQQFLIYANSVYFQLEPHQASTQMIAIHNRSPNCVEFRCQSYCLADYFEITICPDVFRCKPNHTKLCVVRVNVSHKNFVFQQIPVVCEVHRILDKATQLAKNLLEEVESIDNPKWKEDSLLERLLLNVNIKVTGRASIELQKPQEPEGPEEELNCNPNVVIIERLFWDYFFNGDFAKDSAKWYVNDELTYEEVVERKPVEPPIIFDRKTVAKELSRLTADAVRELARNWRFIPLEMAYD